MNGNHPLTVSQFFVGAMDCAAEEQLVRMRLGQIDGIEHITVDLATQHVAVQHGLDTEVVAAAMESLDLSSTHLGDFGEVDTRQDTHRERPALVFALAINGFFFVGELVAGLMSQSMGLVADSLDMGADAAVYALSLLAVGTSALRKKRLARASGYLQLSLAAVGLIEVVRRIVSDTGLPDVRPMIVVSLLALTGNIVTLLVLQRFRSAEVHFQASWIFTANDIKVNTLVIVAAIGVATMDSAVPDLVAGAIIFGIVANGARRILRLAN